jgi:hypothetical protein
MFSCSQSLFLPKPLFFTQFTEISIKSSISATHNGGYYSYNPTGELYYLKFSDGGDSKLKNSVEILATYLFKLAGIPVPNNHLVLNGNKKDDLYYKYGIGVASLIDSSFIALDNQPSIQPFKLIGLTEMFITSAWLADWDAIGCNVGTHLTESKSTEAFRIDFGTALNQGYGGDYSLFKDHFNKEVLEIDFFRNERNQAPSPEIHQDKLIKIFGHITDEDISNALHCIKNISNNDIQCLVYNLYPETYDRENIANILISRKEYLEKRFDHANVLTFN